MQWSGREPYNPPAGSEELEWILTSKYTNGSTLSPPDIGGYKIYYGTIQGVYIDYVT